MKKIKKTIILCAMTLSLSFGMVSSVLAAGSPVATGIITQITSSNANAKLSFTPAKKTSKLQKSVPKEMKAVEVIEISSKEYQGGDIEVVIQVVGIKTGMKTAVLCLVNDQWQYIEGIVSEGQLTVTLPTLSTIALVVEKKAPMKEIKNTEGEESEQVLTANSNSTRSPKTGDNAISYTLGIIGILAVGGSYLCLKKDRDLQ